MRTEPAHLIAADHFHAFHRSIRERAEKAGIENPEQLADQFVVLVEGVINAYHVTGEKRFLEAAKALSTEILDRHFGVAAR